MGDALRIRHLERSDVHVALDWAAAEGWNPGVHDADAFFAADPHGFFGLDVDGHLAVTLSVVRYDDTFSFMGFYICRPDHRGRGFGLALFEDALGRRGDTAVVGVDGVVEQEPNYERDGFVTAHHSVRFGGARPQLAASPEGVRVLGADDVDDLLVFEREAQVFPAPRRAFLERWITAPGTTACAVGDGTIEGYGVVRACREGHKIGPLFCSDRGAAEGLLAALFARVGDGPVFLDVPVPNAEGSAMARDLGLAPVFETARMYRGPDPQLRLDRVFGVITFELG
jgi:GNAT superfamily N-acetyltransferase